MKKYFVTLTTEERQSLHDLTAGGEASARKLAHARILLKADQADGGPAWPDGIAKALDVGLSTIARVRQHFVEQGLEAALGRKPPRGQALTAALPGGRRLVPPGPSGRGRESPLGFEPVVPVGADGLAPRQPEVIGTESDRLGGGTPVLFPRAEGRRDATLLDPQRLGFACRRGRWRFTLVGRGRCLGGPLPAGLALGLDPQRFGLASWRGRWRFALAGWGRCLGGPLPGGLALGHPRSLDRWAPQRTLGSEGDFLERWSAWSPISRDGPCPWRGPWQVRWNDRDCLCRRRAIGRGARGHTP